MLLIKGNFVTFICIVLAFDILQAATVRHASYYDDDDDATDYEEDASQARFLIPFFNSTAFWQSKHGWKFQQTTTSSTTPSTTTVSTTQSTTPSTTTTTQNGNNGGQNGGTNGGNNGGTNGGNNGGNNGGTNGGNNGGTNGGNNGGNNGGTNGGNNGGTNGGNNGGNNGGQGRFDPIFAGFAALPQPPIAYDDDIDYQSYNIAADELGNGSKPNRRRPYRRRRPSYTPIFIYNRPPISDIPMTYNPWSYVPQNYWG